VVRGRSISIGPRGSCCRQYEGREGFWFEKNLAPQHRLWPDAFPETFIRERCLDALGRPAKDKLNALEYCQRRRNEIQRQIDGLKEGPIVLSPDDVGTLAAAMATRTAMALRSEVPLQSLSVDTLKTLRQSLPLWQEHVIKPPVDRMIEAVERGGDFVDAFHETSTVWSGGVLDGLDSQTMDAVALSFDSALRAEGTLLEPLTRKAVEAAYSIELVQWGSLIEPAKTQGEIKAPKPKGAAKTVTIDSLCELSVSEDWHGPTTIAGVRNALNKLMTWAASNHGISLVGSIQSEHMKEYALQLRKTLPKSARKDLSYLSSVFQCAIEHDHLSAPNPCEGIPRTKRSERKRVAKTIDCNKTFSLEQLQQLDAIMKNDPQHDLYLLQRFTGARQQEAAGLRNCDFREIGGYKCIAIEPHESRGMGVEGQTGGIKTPQSQRYIPLPTCLHDLWEKLKGSGKETCFPKEGNERTHGENYRSRFHDKTKRRGLPSGTHSLRETLIQLLTTNDVRDYTVRCITGKAMPMADYVHQDLPKMAEAIELYAKLMPLCP
jgi:hypothetical protein